MARIAGRDTKPEMVVRRLLHAMGCRYRLHAKDLPGKPDIVFRSRRKAILVHGPSGTAIPIPRAGSPRLPKSRLDFWLPKLDANRERDIATVARLEAMGWKVLLVWECQLRDRDHLSNMLRAFVEG
jgi:DNA mismatch endonuclease (patch repair protein)